MIDACLTARRQTINTRLKLLQYEWLMRMHITPVKSHHISANIPDVCTECHNVKQELYFIVYGNVQRYKTSGRMLCEMFQIKVSLKTNFLQTLKQATLLKFGLLQLLHSVHVWMPPH